MKKFQRLAASLLLVGFLVGGGLLVPFDRVEASPDNSNAPRLTVVGESRIEVKPDVAYLNLAVETREKTAGEAQEANTKLMNQVIAAVQQLGVAQSDIRTTGFSLYPIMSEPPRGGPTSGETWTPVVVGYGVQNRIMVTVNDLAQAGKLLDAAIKAGANNSSGIYFDVKDDTAAQLAAIQAAAKNARMKAEAVAGALGITLQGILEINEEGAYIMREPMMTKYDMQMAAGTGSTPILPGDIEVTARVRITCTY